MIRARLQLEPRGKGQCEVGNCGHSWTTARLVEGGSKTLMVCLQHYTAPLTRDHMGNFWGERW